MAVRVHPFPSRTRQLSSLALTILGWKRPGKIRRRQHNQKHLTVRLGAFLLVWLVLVWMGTGYTLLLRCPALSAARYRLASRRPRRQPLLPASATGGGRKRCSSRTRQLSSLALTILGWKRPGKIRRRQHNEKRTVIRPSFFRCEYCRNQADEGCAKPQFHCRFVDKTGGFHYT